MIFFFIKDETFIYIELRYFYFDKNRKSL